MGSVTYGKNGLVRANPNPNPNTSSNSISVIYRKNESVTYGRNGLAKNNNKELIPLTYGKNGVRNMAKRGSAL